MRFVFACGGTGGHINPAIAVANIIKERKPNSEILFIGVENGMETRLVPDAGFEIRTIKASSISRKGGIKSLVGNVRSVLQVITAEKEARKIISEFNPDLVFGTGGYACFPALKAASKMKIPTLVHESNAYPGLATRLLAKKVNKVLLNFAATGENLPDSVSYETVGTPVRGDILMYDRELARRELGLDDKPLLVSFWGSLGAREMNKRVAQLIKLEDSAKEQFYHLHATGKFGYSWMPQEIESLGVDLKNNKNITVKEYINDMPRVLAAADVVMCRGGASTLSEITTRGVPAIIVPSPNVTDNHQYKNAMELKKIGGAVVVEEKDASCELLLEKAKELLFDKEKRQKMSAALIDSAILDATEKIYTEIMNICR